MMRGWRVMAVAAMVAWACCGCMVVSTKGPFRVGSERQAVVIEGEVYLVDVRTGNVTRIPRERIDSAEPLPAQHDEDDDD
jgi:hypothetical protein